MSICLCHIEAIVHNRFFLRISPLYPVKKGDKRTNLPVNDSPIHGEHNGKNFSPVRPSFRTSQPF